MTFKLLAGMLKQLHTRSEHFAASGHAAAAPPTNAMKSRRLIALPDYSLRLSCWASEQEIAPTEMGLGAQFALQQLQAADDRSGSKCEELALSNMSAGLPP